MRRLSATRLRNETGQSFGDALYTDGKTIYYLGALGPDGEADLASARHEDLNAAMERLQERDRASAGRAPFSLEQMLPAQRRAPDGVFLGLADEPVLNAQLAGVAFGRQHRALTVVRMSPQL